MKIHHLNCSTFCFFSSFLITGKGSLFGSADFVCHCLLIETNNELILIDTGLGLRDIKEPHKRLGFIFPTFVRPKLSHEETAFYQIKKLGFSPNDVKHIILTHMDIDHAGGISDFPNAKVHVYQDEYDAAIKRDTFLSKSRYCSFQWEHKPDWSLYETKGEDWFGFKSVRNLAGINEDILLIPLVGHTHGHCGIAVKSEDGWLLHAGDAYFYHTEMNLDKPSCPPLIELAERFLQTDENMRLYNQARLRNLLKDNSSQVKVFCSHDPTEYKSFIQ